MWGVLVNDSSWQETVLAEWGIANLKRSGVPSRTCCKTTSHHPIPNQIIRLLKQRANYSDRQTLLSQTSPRQNCWSPKVEPLRTSSSWQDFFAKHQSFYRVSGNSWREEDEAEAEAKAPHGRYWSRRNWAGCWDMVLRRKDWSWGKAAMSIWMMW